MAKIARFYGWSHEQIAKTPYGLLDRYYKAITHLEADEMMNGMTIEGYGSGDEKSRKDLVKKIDALRFKDESDIMSFDMFAGKLNG